MKSILLISLLLFSIGGISQHKSKSVDSLLWAIQHATKPDSNKVNLLLQLGDAYQNDENDLLSAKQFYTQAGSLSRKIGYQAGILEYIFDYSDALVQQGIYDSSLSLNQEAKRLAIQTKDSSRLVRANFNIGVSYSGLENYPEAIGYFLRAADYYEKKSKMDKVGMCDNELSILFRQTKDYEKAVFYGKRAIELYRKYRTEEKVSIPLQNLSVVYQSMHQTEKAKPLLDEALAINKKYGIEYGELNVLINLVDLNFHQNEPANYLKDVNRILYLSRKMEDKESECDGLLDAAIFYMRNNQLAIAQIKADSALEIANASNLKSLKQSSYMVLSHIAYAAHEYSKALKYDDHADLAQEEAIAEDINRNVAELQTKYETAKKETQIQHLKTEQQLQELTIQKKRTYNTLMIMIIIALLVIGLLFYRNYKRKQSLLLAEQELQQQKIVALEQEKQLMATEAVLQGQEEERSRLAKDLHDGLGGILSGAKYSLNNMKDNAIITPESAAAFERTMTIIDQSISELRRVAHNMTPERLVNQSLSDALADVFAQFSGSSALDINYHLFGFEHLELDNSVKVTVYRIIQELLNNIVKHAAAQNVIVQLIAKDNKIGITVEDNGKGFDTELLDNAKGIGYKNIQSRLSYLKGKIDIQSKVGQGTSVYLEIPF